MDKQLSFFEDTGVDPPIVRKIIRRPTPMVKNDVEKTIPVIKKIQGFSTEIPFLPEVDLLLKNTPKRAFIQSAYHLDQKLVSDALIGASQKILDLNMLVNKTIEILHRKPNLWANQAIDFAILELNNKPIIRRNKT